MKKILVLLLSGAIFLCACSPKGDHSSPSSTPKPSKQSQASSDSIEQDEKAYASTLDSLKNDTSEGRANLYAFYDIDGNGTKELLTGHYFKDQYYLAAIYYLNQGVSTYLAQSRVASAGGSREVTTIYTDGTVFYAQWHSLSPDAKGYLYQLRSDNSGVDVLKEADFQIAGVDIMDLEDATKVLWKHGIYAENGMGCTGPIILVNKVNKDKAKEILKAEGLLS